MSDEQRTRSGAEQWVRGAYPGQVLIPHQRYVSQDFLALEYERLWPYVWQMACREDEVKNVGDYIEYTIGDRSILIVRSDSNTIKGYHNACLHRGRSLKEGCGTAREIRCPFHAWRWALDGALVEIPDSETFHPDSIHPEDLCLPEVRVERWAGFVFINFDRNAEPLRDFLAELPGYYEPILPEEMKVKAVYTLVLDCNWKVALEAFLEGYHVQGIHRQMLRFTDDRPGVPGLVTGRHAAVPPFAGSASVSGGGGRDSLESGDGDGRLPYSPRLGPEVKVDRKKAVIDYFEMVGDKVAAPEDYEIAKVVSSLDLPEGENPWPHFNELLFEDYRSRGIKVPEKQSVPCFLIFPNTSGATFFRHWPVFRARPYGMNPNKCYFDFYIMGRFPEGEGPAEILRETYNPALTGDREYDAKVWGLVQEQDLSNVAHVQRGFHSLQTDGVRPNSVSESSIRHFHESIDGYLMREPR